MTQQQCCFCGGDATSREPCPSSVDHLHWTGGEARDTIDGLRDQRDRLRQDVEPVLRAAEELVEFITDFQGELEAQEDGWLVVWAVSLFREAVGVPGGYVPALSQAASSFRQQHPKERE